MAATTLRQAVVRRVGPKIAKESVKTRYPVAGHLVKNVKVDLAIKNGRVYEVAQAVSFETHSMADLDTQTTSAVYSLGDIHERNRDIRLVVVALPPNPDSKDYSEASKRFVEFQSSLDQIEARLVLEQEANTWAEEVATFVEQEIANHTSLSKAKD